MDTRGGIDWYLAQLRPNGHALAERNLARQGFETFLPRHRATVRRSGRFVTELRPLFPGYLFVAVGAASAPWRTINSTLGVSRLVGFGGGLPSPVPGGLVRGLMARCDHAGELKTEAEFSSGDAVEIKVGPFAEFVATVERVDPDRRVWVLLDLMGRETRMGLAPGDLARP